MLVLLLLLSVAVPSATQDSNRGAQESVQKEESVSEARSFEALFTRLERDWIAAIQKKDKNALDAVLAPEFTLRSSEDPENPLDRDAWIQRALTSYEIRSFSHRAMAIRAFLRVAIVSFVQSQQVTMGGKDRSGDYLVVDLWEVNHEKWQVSARYIAPVSNRVVDATKHRSSLTSDLDVSVNVARFAGDVK
jgi:hypothetical protein